MTAAHYNRRSFLALSGGVALTSFGCSASVQKQAWPEMEVTMGNSVQMIKRPAGERGTTDIGWLDSRHSFSFGGYRDPQHMGFGPLRVINDDRVAAGGGFGTHPHRDMEIISYVVAGALEHKDSIGSGSIIKPGDIQMMRAGTGITHSEYNAAPQTTRFLQIWITPAEKGLKPGYQQVHRPGSETPDDFRLLVSPDGRESSVHIAQDVSLYGCKLTAGKSASRDLQAQRNVWIQVVEGAVQVGDEQLVEGDGLAILGTDRLSIAALQDADVLLFDLPPT